MEIRPLQISDLFIIARMLEKSSVNGEKLTGSEGAWLLLMESLCEAPDDLLAWLADLAGKEVNEFEAMPANTILDIVEQLSQQGGFKDFLLWIGILAQSDGHAMLVSVCRFLHHKYGIADSKTPFSRFTKVVKEVARSRRFSQAMREARSNRQKEVADTLAEADEIIALARGRGK